MLIWIAMVPVLGFAGLCGLLVFLARRGSAIAERTNSQLEREVQTLLRKERENEEKLIQDLATAVDVDAAVTRFVHQRQTLLPDYEGETPWTQDDVRNWREQERQRRVDRLNNDSLTKAVAGFLAIATVSIIVAIVLYHFHASRPQLDQDLAAPTAIPATTNSVWTPSPAPTPIPTPSAPVPLPVAPQTPASPAPTSPTPPPIPQTDAPPQEPAEPPHDNTVSAPVA